jgi:hypothetical protein
MGTTINHGLPYPEGTDLVISGDDAIQALAEAVDAKLEWVTAAAFAHASAGSQAVSTDTVIHFPGTQSLTGFAYDGAGGLHYTGGLRPFLIAVSVTINNTGTDPESRIEVRVNNVTIMGSESKTVGTAQTTTHTISVPCFLESGDVISIVANAAPAGVTSGANALRVFPIGTAL